MLPYVVAHREGLMGSAGATSTSRGTDAAVGSVFNVVRASARSSSIPTTNDVLGYQGIYVGQGRLDRTGDPGTVRMLETEREAVGRQTTVRCEEDVDTSSTSCRAPRTTTSKAASSP